MAIRTKFLLSAALFVALPAGVPVVADPTDTSISELGDATRGQRVFNRCKACHTLTAAKRTRLGPNLDNLFGRKAGSADNYRYSRAMKDADFLWTEAKLNEWLMKPSAFLPGNKMTFAGVRNEKDRKDLIAYLRRATVQTE